MINKIYKKALGTLKERILKNLGDRVMSIVVYGSVAREDSTRDSDIDVLIVGRDKDMWGRISEIAYDVDYENDFETFIIPFYLTKEDLQHRVKAGSPFILEVLREGVLLYDDGTFQRIREKVLRTRG